MQTLSSKGFLIFHSVFWSIAGCGLFVSGATQMPLSQAGVRNLFLTIAGFVTAFSLAVLLENMDRRSGFVRRFVGYGAGYVLAMFCVVVINAITFTQRGVPLAELSFGQWFSGTMNFALVYAFWAELYLQRVFDRRAPTVRGRSEDALVVDDRGRKRVVRFDSMTHVVAAGDYVEIHDQGQTFLERRTLSSLAEILPAPSFLRVHRGVILNTDHVVELVPLPKGRFRISLSSGEVVESSRAYQNSLRDRFDPRSA